METYKSFMTEFDQNPKKFMEESLLTTAKDKSREQDRTLIPGIILTTPIARAMAEFTTTYIKTTQETTQHDIHHPGFPEKEDMK